VVDRYIEIEIEDLYRNKNNYTEEDLKSRISILNEYIDRDVYSNNNNDDDNNDEIVIEPKENDGEEKQEDITTEQHHQQQQQQQEVEQMKFEGGKVFEIVPGEYKNIFVIDVQSLYPNLIINVSDIYYPVVAIKFGRGFLVHTGMSLDEEREYKTLIDIIRRLCLTYTRL
jgi:DNA polymerase elongation subunit (family B)